MADGDPIILAGANGSDGTTSVSRSGTASNTAFSVYNDKGSAVQGEASLTGTGVTGLSDTGVGVHGRADGGVGVEGRSVSSNGVDGRSGHGIGVFGEAGMGAVPPVGVPGVGVGGATREGLRGARHRFRSGDGGGGTFQRRLRGDWLGLRGVGHGRAGLHPRRRWLGGGAW
jgi:hypothetical protein